MRYDLLQLIKDRVPLLDKNLLASNLIESFLKESYNSKIKNNIEEKRIVLDDNVTIITDGNDIIIDKSNEDAFEGEKIGEKIKVTLLDNNDEFVFSYYNYAKKEHMNMLQSYRLSFTKYDIEVADISEWIYRNDVPKIEEYIDTVIINSNNISTGDYYNYLKLYIIDEYYEEERILPDYYRTMRINKKLNEFSLNIDGKLANYNYDNDILESLIFFNDLEKDCLDTKTKKSLLKIKNVLEKSSFKGRQYIKLFEIKRDEN